MTSKDQWPHVDLGYKINKPKMRRKPGRPRKSRIKPHGEVTTTKKRKMCSECNELGHTTKTCQGGPLVKRGDSQHHKMDQDKEAMTQCESYMHCCPIPFIYPNYSYLLVLTFFFLTNIKCRCKW